MKVLVNKAHVVGFEEGRELVIMSTPEGDSIEIVGDAELDSNFPLPEDASLKTIVLQAPWVVPLPKPTVTYFHYDKGIRSFQGPVTLP